jgi:pantoate ligase/cytidylate kinase
MGALHAGHMSLIESARAQCDQVVVSIFVNPLQFGPNEDFAKYPRTFEKDLELCKQAGVQAIFHPSIDELYPSGPAASTCVVPPESLTNRLCGIFRPGHFQGVATIVLKLFEIIRPSRAYFGQKDYQQLTIIKRMVADLNLDVAVVPVVTVRESDGLALSSRNVYLDEKLRAQAPKLKDALMFVAEQCRSKAMPLAAALAEARKTVERLPQAELQYLEACDPDTLEQLSEAQREMVILIACKLGGVRLIDNLIVGR